MNTTNNNLLKEVQLQSRQSKIFVAKFATHCQIWPFGLFQLASFVFIYILEVSNLSISNEHLPEFQILMTLRKYRLIWEIYLIFVLKRYTPLEIFEPWQPLLGNNCKLTKARVEIKKV